jgi:hypothetical protein
MSIWYCKQRMYSLKVFLSGDLEFLSQIYGLSGASGIHSVLNHSQSLSSLTFLKMQENSHVYYAILLLMSYETPLHEKVHALLAL